MSSERSEHWLLSQPEKQLFRLVMVKVCKQTDWKHGPDQHKNDRVQLHVHYIQIIIGKTATDIGNIRYIWRQVLFWNTSTASKYTAAVKYQFLCLFTWQCNIISLAKDKPTPCEGYTGLLGNCCSWLWSIFFHANGTFEELTSYYFWLCRIDMILDIIYIETAFKWNQRFCSTEKNDIYVIHYDEVQCILKSKRIQSTCRCWLLF